MVSKNENSQSSGLKLSDQALQEQVLELPTEMSPDRDLWSGIEKAISTKSQNNFISERQEQRYKAPMAWAASVVAAVLLSWGIYTPQEASQTSGQVNVNLVAAMQQTFEQQKQSMLVSYGQPKLQTLAPEMQEQLKQLTSAQNTIKKALVAEPNNIDLLNLLRWTQQQELDLLKQLYSPQWQSI